MPRCSSLNVPTVIGSLSFAKLSINLRFRGSLRHSQKVTSGWNTSFACTLVPCFDDMNSSTDPPPKKGEYISSVGRKGSR